MQEIHGHSSRDQSPRDGLTMVVFRDRVDHYNIVIDRKKVLLRAQPQQFADISAYLNYDSQVNYDWFLMLLCQAIGQKVARRDFAFDWERLPQNVIAELSILTPLPQHFYIGNASRERWSALSHDRDILQIVNK
jgi:hypothetical protein